MALLHHVIERQTPNDIEIVVAEVRRGDWLSVEPNDSVALSQCLVVQHNAIGHSDVLRHKKCSMSSILASYNFLTYLNVASCTKVGLSCTRQHAQ